MRCACNRHTAARQDQINREVPAPMDDAERHTALRRARERALYWAERAETEYPASSYAVNRHRIEMASMWANVANAYKMGDAPHDGA